MLLFSWKRKLGKHRNPTVATHHPQTLERCWRDKCWILVTLMPWLKPTQILSSNDVQISYSLVAGMMTFSRRRVLVTTCHDYCWYSASKWHRCEIPGGHYSIPWGKTNQKTMSDFVSILGQLDVGISPAMEIWSTDVTTYIQPSIDF